MSDIDRDELRRLLDEAARPGGVFQVAYGHLYDYAVHDRAGWTVAECAGENWVRLIAAAVNALPGLLEALEEAEGHWDSLDATLIEVQREKLALERAIERVRELHRPMNVDALQHGCAAEECGHEFGCPLIEMTVCKACYDLGERERFGQGVPWPCPTIQALDGGE